MSKSLNNYSLFLIIAVFNCCGVSKSSDELLEKAIIEMDKKNFDLAYQHLSSVIEIDSNNAEAYYLRAQVLDLMGKDRVGVCDELRKSASLGYEKSKQIYDQLCKPKSDKKYTQLLNEFDKYISNFPEKYEGYYDRANLNFDYKLYEKAIEDYNTVVKIRKYPVAFYNRGLCYLKLNLKEKACNDFKTAFSLGYKNAKEALSLCR